MCNYIIKGVRDIIAKRLATAINLRVINIFSKSPKSLPYKSEGRKILLTAGQ